MCQCIYVWTGDWRLETSLQSLQCIVYYGVYGVHGDLKFQPAQQLSSTLFNFIFNQNTQTQCVRVPFALHALKLSLSCFYSIRWPGDWTFHISVYLYICSAVKSSAVTTVPKNAVQWAVQCSAQSALGWTVEGLHLHVCIFANIPFRTVLVTLCNVQCAIEATNVTVSVTHSQSQCHRKNVSQGVSSEQYTTPRSKNLHLFLSLVTSLSLYYYLLNLLTTIQSTYTY